MNRIRKLCTAATASLLLIGNSGMTIIAEDDGVYVDGESVSPTSADSSTYEVDDVKATDNIGVKIIASEDNSLTVTTGSVSSGTNGVAVSADHAEVVTEVNGTITAESIGVTVGAENGASVDTTVNGSISGKSGGLLVIGEGSSEVTTTVNGDISSEGNPLSAAIMTSGKDSSTETLVNGNVTCETSAGIITGGQVSPDGTTHPTATSDNAEGTGQYLTEVNGDVSGGPAGVVFLTQKNSAADVIITGTLNESESGKSFFVPEGEHAPVMLIGEDAENMELTVRKIERDGKDIGEDSVIAANYDASSKELTQNIEFEQNIQYIIKVKQTEGAALTATTSTGGALDKKHSEILGTDLDWAYAGDTVLLEVKLEPGYVLRGAYNGDGEKVEKVELLKDANGKYFIKVPRGGGVYLSVSLGKEEEKEASEHVRSGGAASPVIDNVVTCQMAGYPDNYAWNEAAKACQPGFLDDAGMFHPESTAVRKAKIPATADMGLQVYTWILMGSMVIAMLCAVSLRQGELDA